MLTITGRASGVPYDVTVDQGMLTGSDRVSDLLGGFMGESFGATPTSEQRPLSLEDEGSVLAALQSLTEVVQVTGDIPVEEQDDEAPPADAVFCGPRLDPETCNSCSGRINPHTGECRCSD